MEDRTKENKTERVNIRVSPEEKQEMQRIADALGLSLSAYLVWRTSLRLGEKIGDVIIAYHEDKLGRKINL